MLLYLEIVQPTYFWKFLLSVFSVKNTFDQTNFYLDFEGHLEQTAVKKALEELGFHTETLDILGVYESSAYRQK